MMDGISNLSRESDWDEDIQGWQSPKSKKKKKKMTRQVVVASRVSQRIPRDGIPIAEKAALRAKANKCTAGTDKSLNLFTILSNTSSKELQRVLSDVNVVVEEVSEQIGAFKAEELARAALAEANYKVHLEKLRERDIHREEDFPDDVSMGIIDNSARLVIPDTALPDMTKGVLEQEKRGAEKSSASKSMMPKDDRVVTENPKGGLTVPLTQKICS